MQEIALDIEVHAENGHTPGLDHGHVRDLDHVHARVQHLGASDRKRVPHSAAAPAVGVPTLGTNFAIRRGPTLKIEVHEGPNLEPHLDHAADRSVEAG